MPTRPLDPWLAPCPCGSRLRLGQCCGPKQHVDMPPAWAEAHGLWTLARRALGDYLMARHPKAVIAAAYARYSRPPEPGLWGDENWLPLVESWVLYDWLAPGEERPLADEWLARVAPTATPGGRRLLALVRATLDSPLSLFQIERVVPSLGIELRDLLRDKTTFVHDRSLSLSAVPWRIVCARLLPWEGITILDAMGPFPLAATWRSRLWDSLADDGLEPPLEDDVLRGLGGELLALYDDAVSAELDALRAPQRLANTEGHPMVHCEQSYRFAPADLGPILDRLLDLGFEAAAEGDLDDPDRELASLADIELLLVDADRELLPGAGPVDVARITFERARPGTLVLTTSSRERRERFMTTLEAELSPLVERGESHEQDLSRIERWTPDGGWRRPDEAAEPEPSAQRHGPLREEDLAPEEWVALKAELTRMVEAASRAWPDEPVPALGGLTPREAMRTERGRRQVEDLLRSFPSEPPVPGGLSAGLDLDLIRQALGLPRER